MLIEEPNSHFAKPVLTADVELKDKLLVSFSGGETSGYMLSWILKNWSNKYEIKVVFANTGQENEETLLFVQKCSEYFKVEVIWVEAVVNPENRKGTTHKIVNFETASRNGEPFEAVIAKYGIPNPATPHCNREMKLNAINSYMKSIGWKKYYSAIGIRVDEFDRMNAKRKERRLLYPLISEKPMSKAKINQWWNLQPFRLKLKGYQGNCKTCWKKSDAKLYTLINENKSQFDFFEQMENKYSSFIPESRIKLMKERGEEIPTKTNFFRKNRSVADLVKEAKNFKRIIIDDSQKLDNQFDLFDLLEEESCDIYAECGI
jgi:hypothetical protein